jgi:outer membrane protein OmpA-like peptidoglycan-associated protein
MIVRILICGLIGLAAPMAVMADSVLTFPEGSLRGYNNVKANSSYLLPIGPFSAGQMKTLKAEGSVKQQVWKTPRLTGATLDLITPLRDQLRAQGFSVVFECDTRNCGGFDFRFETEVVPEPEMHVDLGDFRFLSAVKQTEDGQSFIGVLASRGANRGFIQVTSVGDALLEPGDINVSTKQSDAAKKERSDDLAGVLLSNGSAVLEGLTFGKGASTLSDDGKTVLQELSAYLNADPTRNIVLVGHTDAEGSLSGNIALSKIRAMYVMQSLIDEFGVAPAQVSAEGVGFLSPRASNASAEGREKNRRVEVVLVTVK